MSDALPLPPRPNVEQYKKLSKELQHASQSQNADDILKWAKSWVEKLARLQGVKLTPEVSRQVAREAEWIQRNWSEWRKKKVAPERCTLTEAQFFVARTHGFASWPRFAKHIEAIVKTDSPVAQFETAVDAIVNGDLKRLDKLLTKKPRLVKERSTREHHSTLLHYVSANGVEDFRQKTPKNIIEITKRLLEAGADVNAESEAYGGRSTTLGLTATSWHPEDAGVQLPLMDLLIAHGAIIDDPDSGSAVNGCLHNGRGEAAEFFASRGAHLDLEGAAGVGRLDIVKSFFTKNGRLKSPATRKQMTDGFAWACQFGRAHVVEFLLDHGVRANEELKHHGGTGLHWAAWGGHHDLVQLLLERGTKVDSRDKFYGGTPLDWALYAWGNTTLKGNYAEVAKLLLKAGAQINSDWFKDDYERARAIKKIESDPQMNEILGELLSKPTPELSE